MRRVLGIAFVFAALVPAWALGMPVARAMAEGSAAATGSVPTTATSVPATETIGRSVQGRPIVVTSVGSGKRRVLVIGGLHGNEYGADVATRFLRYLQTHPSSIPSGTCFDIVTCANPDGWAARKRPNAHGVDLNRNFPARNWSRYGALRGESPGRRPASEPETAALVKLLAKRRYAVVIALHSRGGFIDYDGPGAKALATRMARTASVPVLRLATLRSYPGSLGSYVPERHRIPVITWELSSNHLTRRVCAGLLAAAR